LEEDTKYIFELFEKKFLKEKIKVEGDFIFYDLAEISFNNEEITVLILFFQDYLILFQYKKSFSLSKKSKEDNFDDIINFRCNNFVNRR
jgi:hypothetical protein